MQLYGAHWLPLQLEVSMRLKHRHNEWNALNEKKLLKGIDCLLLKGNWIIICVSCVTLGAVL